MLIRDYEPHMCGAVVVVVVVCFYLMLYVFSRRLGGGEQIYWANDSGTFRQCCYSGQA